MCVFHITHTHTHVYKVGDLRTSPRPQMSIRNCLLSKAKVLAITDFTAAGSRGRPFQGGVFIFQKHVAGVCL